jgi:hypothetical protein
MINEKPHLKYLDIYSKCDLSMYTNSYCHSPIQLNSSWSDYIMPWTTPAHPPQETLKAAQEADFWYATLF